MSKELIIYCDESEGDGDFYSNFYGGALVRSEDLGDVIARIDAVKASLSLKGEVKWSKVTEQYAQKYINLIDVFFDLMAEDKVKMRVMFTQNCYEPRHLTKQQRDESYLRLYYQFIKHAFGLTYSGVPKNTRVRVNFDRLPENEEKVRNFKQFISGLTRSRDFRQAGLIINENDLYEVESHSHDILQCADIVLGAMCFRLNDKHKTIPEGKKRRGKRTVAKERVYKHINGRIRTLYPNFNIGCSTSDKDDRRNRWAHPYRHWNFRSQESVFNEDRTKKK